MQSWLWLAPERPRGYGCVTGSILQKLRDVNLGGWIPGVDGSPQDLGAVALVMKSSVEKLEPLSLEQGQGWRTRSEYAGPKVVTQQFAQGSLQSAGTPVVDTMLESQVEGEELSVGPYNHASTFEDRRKVVQNNLGSGASVANKR